MAAEDRPPPRAGVPCDYDSDPGRYRRGMHVARAHTAGDLYARVARLLGELGAGTVLDVGCADGVLRAALPAPGPWLVGLDTSRTLLRDHPAPVVQADAARLPVRDRAVDAVTAVNVLYHLPDPMPAVHEARRVLRASGRHQARSADRGRPAGPGSRCPAASTPRRRAGGDPVRTSRGVATEPPGD